MCGTYAIIEFFFFFCDCFSFCVSKDMKFVVFWTLWVRSICGFLIYLPTLLLGMAVRSLSDLLDHNSKV